MNTAPQLHHLNARDNRRRRRGMQTLPSGIAVLDAMLPAGGWPKYGLVEINGVQNSSSGHPAQDPDRMRQLRGGALNAYVSGPLGAVLIQKLTDPTVGVVLDSYIDANGQAQGNAAVYIAR